MKKFLKSYSSVIVIIAWTTLTAFINCSQSSTDSALDNNSPKGPLFQASTEFTESGNGGGYNGPHLHFELIPPIDPTEQSSLTTMGLKMQQASMTCQLGDQSKGILGVFPKIQMQFTGIEITQYCYPNTWAYEFFNPVISELNLSVQSLMNSNFALDFDKFKSVSVISSLPSEKQKTAYGCISGIIKLAFQAPKVGRVQANLKSIELSSFDPSEDPPEEENIYGISYKLKIKYSNMDSEAPIIRLITPKELPMIIASSHYYNSQMELITEPESYKSRLVPIFPEDFGIKTKLFDTVSNSLTDYTFNEFEYMSCIQGEIYSDSKEVIESSKANNSTSSSSIFSKSSSDSRSTIAPNCSVLNPWKSSQVSRKSLFGYSPLAGELTTLSKSWEDEYDTKIQVSKDIFNHYLSSQINLQDLNTCLSNTDFKTDFIYTLRSVFYQETVRKIATSPNLIVKQYLKKLSLFDESGAWSLFDLRGLDRLAPNESAAGEHRRHQNVFMDFDKIDPKNWWVIFIHETLHRLDDKLLQGSYEFALTENFQRIKNLSSQHTHLSELSAADKTFVETWIDWGFQRGLKAEYRAWLITFQIYQILRGSSLIPQVDWMSAYLKGQNSLTDEFECQLFSDLNKMQTQTFNMPELNSPLILEAIASYQKNKNTCNVIQSELSILE
jgi:hypothetical protein